jgi:hypothetical protein
MNIMFNVVLDIWGSGLNPQILSLNTTLLIIEPEVNCFFLSYAVEFSSSKYCHVYE